MKGFHHHRAVISLPLRHRCVSMSMYSCASVDVCLWNRSGMDDVKIYNYKRDSKGNRRTDGVYRAERPISTVR